MNGAIVLQLGLRWVATSKGPAEHIRMSEIWHKQFFAEKSCFGEKVGVVIDLHPFHHIDYFEVPDHNQL